MTVAQFIKADRQWPRRYRIAHAKNQLHEAMASLIMNRHFWREVIEANEDEYEFQWRH